MVTMKGAKTLRDEAIDRLTQGLVALHINIFSAVELNTTIRCCSSIAMMASIAESTMPVRRLRLTLAASSAFLRSRALPKISAIVDRAITTSGSHARSIRVVEKLRAPKRFLSRMRGNTAIEPDAVGLQIIQRIICLCRKIVEARHQDRFSLHELFVGPWQLLRVGRRQ